MRHGVWDVWDWAPKDVLKTVKSSYAGHAVYELRRVKALLFDVGIPLVDLDMAEVKALKLCDRLEGLGFRTFLGPTSSSDWRGSAWEREYDLDSPVSSSTYVLAIKAADKRHYKKEWLRDLHTLDVFPQEGIELQQFGAVEFVTRRLKRSDYVRYRGMNSTHSPTRTQIEF